MGKRIATALLSAGAVALTIGLSAPAALAAAAATWTVSPGGAITGKAGTTTLTDTTSSISLSCTSSKLAGSLKSGKGLPGKGLGTVTSVAFNKCTVLSVTISLSSGKVAWKLNASSYNSRTGTTSRWNRTIARRMSNQWCCCAGSSGRSAKMPSLTCS